MSVTLDYVDRNEATFDVEQQSVAPQANVTGAVNGSAVKVGKNARVMCNLRIGGAVTGTTPTLSVTVEGSDDGATGWVAIDQAIQATDADANSVLQQLVLTKHKYVRAVLAVGGTSPDFADVEVFFGGK